MLIQTLLQNDLIEQNDLIDQINLLVFPSYWVPVSASLAMAKSDGAQPRELDNLTFRRDDEHLYAGGPVKTGSFALEQPTEGEVLRRAKIAREG